MADLICIVLPYQAFQVLLRIPMQDGNTGRRYTKSASDRASLIDKANLIYRKYGETTNKSTIKLRPFGMRLW